MKKTAWLIGGVVALVASIAAPFVLSGFSIGILTTAYIFAIFALSLNLILGHGGLPSLGHAVFFGIGGYTVALLMQHGTTNVIVCFLAAVATSMAAAALIGPVVLRTREIYFLMVTLAIGEVLRNVAISWRSLTSGDDGISGLNIGNIAGIDFGDTQNFYFLALGSLLITMVLMALLTNAPFGYALRALRDNRRRISVLGVHPFAVEVIAFLISAGIAGFAGGLIAYDKAFVSPNIFSVETSAQALLMVVLGGAGTLFGPVAGAVAVEFVRGIGSVYTDRWQTVLGLMAVFVALNSRQVLLGGALTLIRPYLSAKKPKPRIMTERLERQEPTPLRDALNDEVVAPAALAAPISNERANGALLSVENIVMRFGGLSVLDGISLSVASGERHGLIGPNGAGKTTFLNILSSILPPTGGKIQYQGEDITRLPPYRRAQLGIGRTFQIGNLFNDCTVRENIVLALIAREGYAFRLGTPLYQYGSVHLEASELLDNWSLREIADVPVKLLSYGQRRVIEIVLALAMRPKILLLDEPAAGLSGAETKTIIETIGSLDPNLTLLIVEHDMDLIFSVCDRVTVIANGKVLAEGEGDSVRRNQLVIDAYLGMPL